MNEHDSDSRQRVGEARLLEATDAGEYDKRNTKKRMIRTTAKSEKRKAKLAAAMSARVQREEAP